MKGFVKLTSTAGHPLYVRSAMVMTVGIEGDGDRTLMLLMDGRGETVVETVEEVVNLLSGGD